MDSRVGPVGPSVVFEDVKGIKASSFVLCRRHGIDSEYEYLVKMNGENSK